MKNSTTQDMTFWFATAAGLVALIFLGPNVNAAVSGSQGYVVAIGSNVVMSGTGACVHDGLWRATDSVAGCDPLGPAQRVAVAPQERAAPVPVAVPQRVVVERIILTSDTLFDDNSSVVKRAGQADLDNLAAKLEGNQRELVVIGYTSSTGSEDYNMKLSQRRAASVKTYLVSRGIDGNRIHTDGKGEQNPVADNATAEGQSLNRRVEIEVMTTSDQTTSAQ